MRYAMAKVRTQFGIALLAAVLLALAVPPARALLIRPHRPGHSEQQQVLHVDDQIRTALLTADASALDKVLADDFLGISANGTLSDKQQYLRRIGKREHQFSRIEITDRKVRLQTNSAVVVTTAEVTGKLDSTPISGVFRYTRVYSRESDGAWKMRNFEATRVVGSGTDELRHGIPIAARTTEKGRNAR